MTIYSLVVILHRILVILAMFLGVCAGLAWWYSRPAPSRLEGSYGDRLALGSRSLLPAVRFAGFWWLPVLLAGVLQWLLGLDSPMGWRNLLGCMGSVLALIIARGTVRTARMHAHQPTAFTLASARRRLALLGILAALVTAVWIGGAWSTPSYPPHSVNLRRFDPDAVAHLETAMWRSYYDKQRVRLFLQLRELMGVQYRFPRLSSLQEAYWATRAAFVFKVGKERSDYEKALPYLESYYQEIRQIGNLSFDPKRVAALELEWWIVHRQEDRYSMADLTRACAVLMAEMYGVDLDRVLEHGRLRAEAMKIRDRKAITGGMTDSDWSYIESILSRSYRSLHEAVQM